MISISNNSMPLKRLHEANETGRTSLNARLKRVALGTVPVAARFDHATNPPRFVGRSNGDPLACEAFLDRHPWAFLGCEHSESF